MLYSKKMSSENHSAKEVRYSKLRGRSAKDDLTTDTLVAMAQHVAAEIMDVVRKGTSLKAYAADATVDDMKAVESHTRPSADISSIFRSSKREMG